jgi:hypothetical protein
MGNLVCKTGLAWVAYRKLKKFETTKGPRLLAEKYLPPNALRLSPSSFTAISHHI